MSEKNSIILSLKEVSYRYKSRCGLFKTFEHTALKNVKLNLLKGESLGIIGRNGCGKSTLLKILAGIIDPTSGTVDVSNAVTRSLLSLGVGFLPELSGRDNAMLSAMLLGKSKGEAKDALASIYEFSELGKFFDQPVKAYSAGMKARLGFATSLLVNVDILLIDEILGVGDIRFRKKAENAMKEKINSRQTVVFVSHNGEQITNLCDRGVWLKDGEVFAEGDASHVVKLYQKFMNQQ